MPMDVNMYLNLNESSHAINKANEIIQKLNLAARTHVKDYGEVKESDQYSERFSDWNSLTSEYLKNTRKMSNPMYSLWNGIKSRCYNQNSMSYGYYGEEGITMDSEWKSNFTKFAEYVLDNLGAKPERYFSIDRIDNTKGYEPGNIRWAAPLKQARNKKLGKALKISEEHALTLAYMYKYYKVSGRQLMNIYNDYVATDESLKIKKSWAIIYNACKSYCPFV